MPENRNKRGTNGWTVSAKNNLFFVWRFGVVALCIWQRHVRPTSTTPGHETVMIENGRVLKYHAKKTADKPIAAINKTTINANAATLIRLWKNKRCQRHTTQYRSRSSLLLHNIGPVHVLHAGKHFFTATTALITPQKPFRLAQLKKAKRNRCE